jgi:8-amino-7-oxononanoate synthase
MSRRIDATTFDDSLVRSTHAEVHRNDRGCRGLHEGKKLDRLPVGDRNRLVVVEGLYSVRGDVAPLREIVEVCRSSGAYLLVDEAHSLGTFGRNGLGCAEAQGVLQDVDFIVGTFSKSLAGIGGVCVSDHPELQALHFAARAYIFTASGSPANIAGVHAAVRVIRQHPELRDRLWARSRGCATACRNADTY